VNVDLRRLSRLGWRALLVVAILASVPLFSLPLLKDFHAVGLYDFRGGLYNAGTAILHGLNPYHAGFLAHQAAIMRAGGVAIGETTQRTFSLPVYPAPANLAIIPLSLLPFWLAGTIYSVLSVAAIVLAIWWLEVRDWRCYALTLLSSPFILGMFLGALGPFLVLGAAAAWRWRDRLWAPAIAIATIVVAKIFPCLLAIWLLATRRYRAFWLAVAIGVAVTLIAWATIGFAGMLEYPQMLANVSFIQELRASSLVAILIALGFSPFAATVLAVAAGIGLLAEAWRVARGPDGDRKALGLAIIASLTAAPIVWDHYFVLLFIPIALRSPKLSGLWFLPLTAPILVAIMRAVVPGSGSVLHPNTLRNATAWVMIEAVVALSLYVSPADLRVFQRRITRRLRPGASATSAEASAARSAPA
jgi:Glycosyltransferase family 87